jgi:hypothetical protein
MEDKNGGKYKVTPQTRFVFEDENGLEKYFDYFADLAPHLNERLEKAANARADRDFAKKRETREYELKKLSLRVASIAFLAAVLAVIVLLFTDKAGTPLLVAAVAGLVSSGAAFFYGAWRPIDTRPPRKT